VKLAPFPEIPVFQTKRSSYLLIIFSFLIATSCLLGTRTVQASSLIVKVQDSLVDLQAEQVPLIKVIEAICEKTGIVLKSSDPMTEPVSVDFKGITLEKCLRRLLSKRSYALVTEQGADDEIIYVSLHILAAGSPAGNATSVPQKIPSGAIEQAAVQPPEDPSKRYERESFSQMFEDSKNLKKQISAQTLGTSSQGAGILITKLSKESVLKQIGLDVGDTVNDVNGKPVSTADELIELVQTESQDRQVVRIERLRRNDVMDPIYIFIESQQEPDSP